METAAEHQPLEASKSILPGAASSKNESVPILSKPFLGQVVEICIVTGNAQKTTDGLLALGIGPFTVHTFSPDTVSKQTWRGQPAAFELQVCFAQQGSMTWEIMQPVSGPSIMAEFLERHGDGIHHVAFDCDNVPTAQRKAEFERRGFQVAQSGLWHGEKGTCEFIFFETESAVNTCFESYSFSEDWKEPQDTVIYPP